jgi:hypothetical protein
VVAVAIDSFASPHDITRGKPLAPLLFTADDAVPPAAMGVVRVSHLEQQFQPRRRPTSSHVEVRSLSEFDSIIRALQKSQAFQTAKERLSVCVNVTVFAAPPDDAGSMTMSVRPMPLCSASHWHLCPQHYEPFAQAVRASADAVSQGAEAMLGSGKDFEALQAPQRLVAGHIVVTERSQISAACTLIAHIDSAAEALAGKLAAAPRKLQQHGTSTSRSGRGTHAGPTASSDVGNTISELQAEKARLVTSISDADAELERVSSALDGAERLELAQREAEHLVAEHDEAESTFAILLERLREEKEERRRLESEVAKDRARFETEEERRREAERVCAALEAEYGVVRKTLDLARNSLADEEAVLSKLEAQAHDVRARAKAVADESKTKLDREFERLVEARSRSIDESNTGLLRAQEEASADHRRSLEALEAQCRRHADRAERAAAERRAAQSTLMELQSKLAHAQELARVEERNTKLATAQYDQLKRKWGDDVGHERLRALELEDAGISAELSQLTSHRDSVQLRLDDARRAQEVADSDLNRATRSANDATDALATVRDRVLRERAGHVVRTEALHRSALENVASAAWDDIRTSERVEWQAARRTTEAMSHAEGHSFTRQEIAVAASRVNVAHERILAAKNRLDIHNSRLERAKDEHAVIVDEYHARHEALLDEEREEAAKQSDAETQPEGETEADRRLSKELRAATEGARRRANRIRQALSRAPVDPLASVRPVVLPSVAEVQRRLARLLRDARRRTRDADAEASNTERTLRRVSREVDERAEVRSRVRHAVTRYESRIEELDGQYSRASGELASRTQRDSMLREQLKLEFHNAHELTARHKREDQERLREAYEAVDELRANVQESTSQVQRLRADLAALRRRNTTSNEETLSLELRHEARRAKELDRLLSDALHRARGTGPGLRAPSVDPSAHALFESAVGTPADVSSVRSFTPSATSRTPSVA